MTDWIGNPEPVAYGGELLDQSAFLSWAQLREMRASGLVEVASHSHDLHRGIEANPQGNLQPAAVARSYTGRGYESDAAYTATHDGAIYRFASAANRDLFKANPAKYAPVYGGYCAYGTTLG